MGFAGALPILLASAHSAETPDSDRTTATNTSNSPRENSGRRFPRRRSTPLIHEDFQAASGTASDAARSRRATAYCRETKQNASRSSAKWRSKSSTRPPTSGCRRATCSPCGGRGCRTITANCAPFAPARFMRASGLRNLPLRPSGASTNPVPPDYLSRLRIFLRMQLTRGFCLCLPLLRFCFAAEILK